MKPSIFLILLFIASCKENNSPKETSATVTALTPMPIDTSIAAPNKFDYVFEGSEPFWDFEIQNNTCSYLINGDQSTDTLYFSNASFEPETIGFKGNKVFGIINKTWNGDCSYAVTEDSSNYEIFIVHKGETYRGCGRRK